MMPDSLFSFLVSLPVWECGLKSLYFGGQLRGPGHSLYGSVD